MHVFSGLGVFQTMGKRRMLASVLLVVALTGLRAQTVSIAAPQFEVASVRPCQNGQSPKEGELDPDRLHLACVTLANLIRLAYLVFPTGEPNAPVSPSVFQMPISGGPSWINAERYTVDAKAERPVNTEMMKGPMMQALLEDRFGLKLHTETKEIPAFELTVGAKGAKLQPAKDGACVVYDRNHPPPKPEAGEAAPVLCGEIRENTRGGFDLMGVTMADLCRHLSMYVDHDIVDKTGIAGTFDVHLDLLPADLGIPGATPDPSAAFTPGDGGAIGAALKKLRLTMRSGKRPAEFLVIDRVERPSEN
jgi:uncharacterized protein (TIGR03435 family)